MFFDPGYVPKLGGLTEQKQVIDELLGLWKYDDQNFCVTCMVRMPLRYVTSQQVFAGSQECLIKDV